MVSIRCKIIVKQELENLGLHYTVVELGEVEAVVRSLSGVDAVVAVAWPKGSNADGIELFLETEKFDTELLMKQLKTKLPYYMVPRRIRTLPRLPLNPNGKYDRKALQAMVGPAVQH